MRKQTLYIHVETDLKGNWIATFPGMTRVSARGKTWQEAIRNLSSAASPGACKHGKTEPCETCAREGEGAKIIKLDPSRLKRRNRG